MDGIEERGDKHEYGSIEELDKIRKAKKDERLSKLECKIFQKYTYKPENIEEMDISDKTDLISPSLEENLNEESKEIDDVVLNFLLEEDSMIDKGEENSNHGGIIEEKEYIVSEGERKNGGKRLEEGK